MIISLYFSKFRSTVWHKTGELSPQISKGDIIVEQINGSEVYISVFRFGHMQLPFIFVKMAASSCFCLVCLLFMFLFRTVFFTLFFPEIGNKM